MTSHQVHVLWTFLIIGVVILVYLVKVTFARFLQCEVIYFFSMLYPLEASHLVQSTLG